MASPRVKGVLSVNKRWHSTRQVPPMGPLRRKEFQPVPFGEKMSHSTRPVPPMGPFRGKKFQRVPFGEKCCHSTRQMPKVISQTS